MEQMQRTIRTAKRLSARLVEIGGIEKQMAQIARELSRLEKLALISSFWVSVNVQQR